MRIPDSRECWKLKRILEEQAGTSNNNLQSTLCPDEARKLQETSRSRDLEGGGDGAQLREDVGNEHCLAHRGLLARVSLVQCVGRQRVGLHHRW
jgi:hypothetical protein